MEIKKNKPGRPRCEPSLVISFRVPEKKAKTLKQKINEYIKKSKRNS